ncbi:MAG: hypothetical protein M3245_04315 [Actinomycetota bacterium]|nr:hypothetical protein [Actinomycetota bacterium]
MTRAMALAVTGIVLSGCGNGAPAPPAPPPAEETPTPVSPPADRGASPDIPLDYVSGTATVQTTGDVETDFEAPLEDNPAQADNQFLPERAEFQVSWQTEGREQLLLTGTFREGVPGGLDFFVAIRTGPGENDTYFPDSFHTQCEVILSSFTAEGLGGTFECGDLESFDGTQRIDATGSFQATSQPAS